MNPPEPDESADTRTHRPTEHDSPLAESDPTRTLTGTDTGFPSGMAEAPPPDLGRYQLVRMLGQGAFGQVWLAYDPELRRQVAIKVPKSLVHGAFSTADPSLEEARRLAALKIPGIVRVYDVGQTDSGQTYIVSEYVEGGTLSDRLDDRERRFSKREGLELVAKVAEALGKVHKHQVIHRDVKPANILLDESDNPILVDFGLAITREELLEGVASRAGTLAYMAPEQLRGETEKIGPASDVFALGVLLSEIILGRRPFQVEPGHGPDTHRLHRPTDNSRDVLAELSGGSRAICRRCVAEEPVDRYHSGTELAEDLRRLLQQRVSRRWAGTLLTMGLVALVGILVIASPWLPRDDSRPAQVPEAADPLGWRERLGVTPGELEWPGRDGTTVLKFEPALDMLSVASDSDSLIRLGDLDPEGGTLEFQLQRPDGWGSIDGVFFGYAVREIDGRPIPCVHGISLRHADPSPGKRPDLLVSRWWGVLAADGSGLIISRRFDTVRLNDDTPLRFRIVIRGDNLEELTLGDQRLKKLEGPYHSSSNIPQGSWTGAWGVLNRSGTTWISDPKFTPFEEPRDD